MVLIDALFEMVTDVGAPLFVKVAVLSGTAGLELQLLPWVHSLETGAPPPSQVPSVACAAFGANTASAPSHTLPSSAARSANGAGVAAIPIALLRPAARGTAGAAARVACQRDRCERIPQPLGAPAALPTPPRVTDTWPCGPRYGPTCLRSIRAGASRRGLLPAVAFSPRREALAIGALSNPSMVNGNGSQTSATTSHVEIPEPHSGAANRATPRTL
jgi:hypothetical protein